MYNLTGTKRWLDIIGFKFQPSELAKISYILLISKELILYDIKTQITHQTFSTDLKLLWRLIGLSLPLYILMFMQKDFGTSLVFLSILGALLVAANLDWKILFSISILLIILGSLLLFLVFTEKGNTILELFYFKEYQLNRIRAWRNPYAYSNSIAYQQVQSFIALGSGGVWGKGVTGIEVYVPVRESDMIFTFIGESYGFIGSTLVIFLYLYTFFQIILAGIKSNSKFNVYICIGIVSMLFFQIFENIGASIGILPLTGIPLPFLSQGGTSLISTLMSLGLVFEIDVNQIHISKSLS